MADWIEGKVVENIHWTENLFTLKVAAAVNDFDAGQFTSLALDINGERIARPYSFLSAPGAHPLEFFFYTALDGVLSNALVALNAGDKIWVKRKANGFFILNEVPSARDLWLIGTGTGIAPYLSILQAKPVWEKFTNIVLVQGVRTKADLRYQELIAQFKLKFPQRFSYQAFVSREDISSCLQGRIPTALESGALEQAVERLLEPEHSQIMLCGNPEMVKSSLEILKLKGFKKNLRRKPGHVTTENYW